MLINYNSTNERGLRQAVNLQKFEKLAEENACRKLQYTLRDY